MYRFKHIILLAFVLSMIAALSASAQQTPGDFWQKADVFLKENVSDEGVAYTAIAQNPSRLNQLVQMIDDITPEKLTPHEKKAFYIDAYNILTIHSIIKNEIPDSPMDVHGFFDGIKHNVAGQRFTLNEIEKGILFPEFSDARMHFALVCAANGCPPLQSFAYQPDKLNTQLDRATKTAMNDAYFIRVSDENQTAKISEIFKWYEQDFLAESESVLGFINRYRSKQITGDYSLDYYKYDWSINGE